jgi:PAS domain S-box-containing protein
MSFLDSSLFAFGPFAVPMVMTSMAILGFGVWVLAVNRFDRLHQDFFALCCVLTGWLTCQSLAFSALQPHEGVIFARLVWAFVLFIPPATFALNMSILGYKELRERLIPVLYILAAVFLPTVLTDQFVDSRRIGSNLPYSHAFPACGPVNYAYLIVFAVSFVAIIVLHSYRLRNPILPPRDRGIYQLTFIATIIGTLGTVDWMECVGWNLPTIGFLPIAIWISLFAYGIFRYRLFQLTTAVAAPIIVEALPGALFVVNTEGEIVIVNPGAKSLTKQTEHTLLGRNIRDFLPKANETLKCALQNLEGGSCSLDGLETTLKADDGKEVPVSLSARVIRRPDGAPDGAIFIAVEITRLKEEITLVEKQREELVQAVEEMRRTQKLLIGREKRMIELKQELDQLKGENKPPTV